MRMLKPWVYQIIVTVIKDYRSQFNTFCENKRAHSYTIQIEKWIVLETTQLKTEFPKHKKLGLALPLLIQIVLQHLPYLWVYCIMCFSFFLISPRQRCALPFSVGLSAASSCYRWTGGDSDHEVAPPLPFIIPSWRLRSGLTLALPLPFLFRSLHTAFLIRLGHPI